MIEMKEAKKSLSFWIIIATIATIPIAMFSVSVLGATTPLVIMIIMTLIGSVTAMFYALKN